MRTNAVTMGALARRLTVALFVATIASAVVGLGAVVAQDGLPSPEASAQPSSSAPPVGSALTVVPPGGDPLGVPYREWGARWWQWLLSVPASESPGTIDNCQANQEEEAFFIPHTRAGTSDTVLCTIEAGRWILASPASTIWVADEGDTNEELRRLVRESRSVLSNLVLTVDGIEVPDIDSYWVVSPPFEVDWIEDNLLEAQPGTVGRAVAGGWFVMIPPLEPGDHVVSIRNDITFPDDPAGTMSALLIAIITVVGEPGQGPLPV